MTHAPLTVDPQDSAPGIVLSAPTPAFARRVPGRIGVLPDAASRPSPLAALLDWLSRKLPGATLLMLKRVLAAMLLACLLLYLGNLPFLSAARVERFDAVAHRGVHHTYSREDLTNETCTATRINPPTHEYIENTLPSMRAAFAAGATRIEIDVHRTTDGELAIFHDWTLDCRTEHRGETRKQSLALLQSLDVGYGYTADGGATFPLRGKGIGAMPSLRQVLTEFPDGHFVIDQKDRDAQTTALVSEQLRAFDAVDRVCLHAIPDRRRQYLAANPAGCTFAGRQEIKSCLIDYLKVGWFGAVPSVCRQQRLVVPAGGLSRLLWGWPGTFVERMRAHGSRVYVYTDDASESERWRAYGFDGLWTDRIEMRASNASR